MSHLFKEAYMLMTYQDEVTGEKEVIWNSRDGITPFIVTSRAGNPAKHINWQRDIYAPGHVPQPGERIFINLTLARARALRARYVDEWWDSPVGDMKMCDMYDSKEAAIEELSSNDLASFAPCTPDLIEVCDAINYVDEDVCGFCGLPGADKIPHPIYWPGEDSAGTEYVHAECENVECARAHSLLSDKERAAFLRTV